MADLEDMGYLEQPHTSSGRVPTKLGYHFYIDSLMNGYKLSAMETIELNNILKGKIGELDSLMTGVSKLVSSLTNYTAVALKAENKEQTVDRFSYMILDAHSFLVVMRMADSSVVTKQIQTHVLVDDRMMKRLTQLLTKYLARVSAKDISFSVVMDIEREMGVGGAIVAPSVKAVYEAIGGGSDADLRFEGVNRLLEYPEFSDIDKIRGMLEMMEYFVCLTDEAVAAFESMYDRMGLYTPVDEVKVLTYYGWEVENPDQWDAFPDVWEAFNKRFDKLMLIESSLCKSVEQARGE